MKVLATHPGPLMYTKLFLRLEPLGLEVAAQAARKAGHDVRLIDLQVEERKRYDALLADWRPDAVALSCNYLANVPEVVELAKAAKAALPHCFVFVGGHSASFVADELLEHGAGAIDCVLRGEGEASVGALLLAAEHDRGAVLEVPGAVTQEGSGPPPVFVDNLDDLRPARDLLRKRRKYFIGLLDPAASIEFSRGCPWDCNFCSAWTFYGRNYRTVSPEVAVEELASLREPGVFIVDDVAFIQGKHGMAIGEEIARRGIKKEYYLETRADVLLRNKDVFRLWARLGMRYMFLGIEAVDEEGLQAFRKRSTVDQNMEALEFARSLGIQVAINIIADPGWDRERFRVIRQFIEEVPEIVNVSVTTPYPGTEIWHTEQRRLTTHDYRLFDIQHAVLPTTLPLEEFYAELVETQSIMNRKHMRWRAIKDFGPTILKRLAHGQTNYFGLMWKFNSIFNADVLAADHRRTPPYVMRPQGDEPGEIDPKSLYIHASRGRKGRQIDDDTEKFVDATRMGAAS